MPAALIPAAVGAAGTVAGSLISSGAQASAANKAANTQLAMYNQTRQDLAPFSQAGSSAISALSRLLGMEGPAASTNMLDGLQNYPGYQFAFDQGQQAVDRSAAARGLLLSGGQLKDLTNYGQGQASQLFGNYFNQLYNLSSLGENAAANTGNAGTSAASGIAQSQIGAGTANASGIQSAFNNTFGPGGGLQNAFEAYQLSQLPSNNVPLGTEPAFGGGFNPYSSLTVQPSANVFTPINASMFSPASFG